MTDAISNNVAVASSVAPAAAPVNGISQPQHSSADGASGTEPEKGSADISSPPAPPKAQEPDPSSPPPKENGANTTNSSSSPSAPPSAENDNLPAKRPSPWRQPKSVRDAAAAADEDWSRPISRSPSKKSPAPAAAKTTKKAAPSLRKLFQDVVSVRIPMNVTADLGVAVQRTREKRTAEIHRLFPELKPAERRGSLDQAAAAAEGSADEDDEDNNKGTGEAEDEEDDKSGSNNNNGKSKKKPQAKKPLKNVPRPQDYASIMDYLEAKYVQGVQIDDEDDDGEDDEGQGSVYSTTSFLDDADLQRSVAEQVMAQSTSTRLELESNDNDFFVNVGNLEVEETELTKEQYDPLEDTKTKSPVKRKRKKPAAPTKDKASSASATDTKKTVKKAPAAASPKAASAAPPAKKKPKIAPVKAEKDDSGAATKKKTSAGGGSPLAKEAKKRKTRYEEIYASLVQMIKEYPPESLPRRKTKERVTITCPDDKGPGDSILFANPHVPGQKLKAKVPKSAKPGGTFRVTVPVAPPAEDDDTDHNKLNRTFYDALDDYARAFDDWCDAEGDYRKSIGDKDFGAHFEKRTKFDSLVKEFPKDLKTTVDKPYLQKILRRARQNKHKRKQTMAKQTVKSNIPPPLGKRKSPGSSASEDEEEEAAAPKEEVKRKKIPVAPAPKKISVTVPELTTEFPVRKFNEADFTSAHH